jgi:hypothetical protein
MRLVIAVAMAVILAMACGGGASSPPIKIAPAVTNAPTTEPAAPAASNAPDASAMPKATPGYDYGY